MIMTGERSVWIYKDVAKHLSAHFCVYSIRHDVGELEGCGVFGVAIQVAATTADRSFRFGLQVIEMMKMIGSTPLVLPLSYTRTRLVRSSYLV